jgi:hypothetical protein
VKPTVTFTPVGGGDESSLDTTLKLKKKRR